MAKEPGSDKSLEQIKSEIDRSRHGLSRDVSGLRYELDLPAKIKSSFRQKPASWIAAAVVLGVVLVALPRGRKKIYVQPDGTTTKGKSKLLETGFLLGALRIAATLAKPAVINFIRQRMAGDGRAGGGRSRSW
jgi:hypothetical protein